MIDVSVVPACLPASRSVLLWSSSRRATYPDLRPRDSGMKTRRQPQRNATGKQLNPWLTISVMQGSICSRGRQHCRSSGPGHHERIRKLPNSKNRFPAPAWLSGTFLQTLPDLVTPLKGHSIFISTQLSTDAVSALRKVWVLINYDCGSNLALWAGLA